MTPKALIFDVDGTLAETEEIHRRAFNETFAEARMGWRWNWSVEDYRRLLRTTGGKERMARYRDDIGWDMPDAETISALHQRKTERYMQLVSQGQLRLRAGVADLIAASRARGLKIAVATTTNRPNVDILCEVCWGLPASEVFDVIAAGDEVVAKKPAPDVYLLALERLGLRAQDCIAFEDSLNGLQSARAAGLACVVTPSIYTSHETFDGAATEVDDLTGYSRDLNALRDLVAECYSAA